MRATADAQITRALFETGTREAADLVGELTLLLDRMSDRDGTLALARLLTRRIADRLSQASFLQGYARAQNIWPDSWSPLEVIEELEHEAVSLAGQRLDIKVLHCELLPQAWFFDRELVGLALRSGLHAALGHARAAIELQLRIEDGYIGFSITDDAGSFPPSVLAAERDTLQRGEINGNSLGVHFARLVASSHVNAQRSGRLELSNLGDDRGTRFTLWLP